MMHNRNLIIEDAISPLVERAKIAFGSFGERMEHHSQKWAGQEFNTARQEEYAAVFSEGHPSRAEIKLVFRGLGLGIITREEVRAVIIRMFLRDTPEDTGDYETQAPMQKLARTVANWIMGAFDDACWMSEEEAGGWLASARPHTTAG